MCYAFARSRAVMAGPVFPNLYRTKGTPDTPI
jgi:hypothetical protein